MNEEIDAGPGQATRTNFATVVKLIVAIVLAAGFAIFSAQNSQSIDIEFLSWEFSMRKFLVMILSALTGIVVWELGRVLWRHRRRDAR